MSDKTAPKLNAKQTLFVEYYISPTSQGRGNAAEAARMAGYSAKSARQQGHRLLTNDDIKDEIRARLDALQVSTDEALVTLGLHARGNLGNFVKASPEGVVGFDFTAVKAEHWLTVKTLEITPTELGPKIKMELHDVQAAIAQIIKQHQLKANQPTDHVIFNFGVVTEAPSA